MTVQSEQVAHAELVGGGETAKHSHAGAGSVDLKPYKVIDTIGNQALTGTVVTINLNSEEISNANYSLSNDEITIIAAGIYLVTYVVNYEITNTSGSTRGGGHAWVETDDSGSYAAIVGSHSYDYHREAGSAPGSGCEACFLVKHNTANKKIRLRAERSYGSTNIDTIANTIGLSILKVG